MPTDPSRTLLLRNVAARACRVRFNRIERVMPATAVALVEKSGILLNATAPERRRFEFLSDAEKLVAFRAWLGEQVRADILTETRGRDHWLLLHIARGYSRGAQAARRKLGERFLESLGYAVGSYNPFNNPRLLGSAEAVFARAFEQLEGITQAMSQQMSRVLSDGLLEGLGAKELSRRLRDRISAIGKTRSELLARTEIIRAHSIGQIAEMDTLGEAIGSEFKYEWVTGLDGRVRPRHQAWHGRVFTREEVLARIGEPNCRCSQNPVIPEFDDDFDDSE